MAFVEHEDGRKLSIDAQEERRKTIVRMKKRGHTLQQIQDAVGLSKTAVCKALNMYAEGGWSALRGGMRGRRKGENRSLTPKQEKLIRRKIVDRRPEQLKLDFALWTREAVRQLILQECAVDMPIRTVGEYLKRWGFTPQRPARFAYERREAEVTEWLEERFPAIRRRAKTEGAEIYWGDETGMRASDVRGRGYAPRGETPLVNATAKYENLSMVSAITNRGRVHWMIVDGAVNAARFIEFLDALVRDADRKVFLVLDNLKVHHSRLVKEWLGKHTEEIELFFLPAYSPDLNPDEHLNADVKQGVGSRAPVRTKNRLHTAITNHMNMLQRMPERICKYFQDPAISYAGVLY
jgi:transposase